MSAFLAHQITVGDVLFWTGAVVVVVAAVGAGFCALARLFGVVG